jgi:hypothetical protein
MKPLLFLLCVGILLWTVKECKALHSYPQDSTIIELQSYHPPTITRELSHRRPLLIMNVIVPTYSFESLVKENPGYILEDGGSMKMFDTCLTHDMSIYKHEGLYKTLIHDPHVIEWSRLFEDWFSYNSRTYLSLYKGFHTIPAYPCHHNYLLVGVLSGSAILYLIHPTHKEDIQQAQQQHIVDAHESNDSLKKWSQKIVLKPGSLCVIPSDWWYFYECKGDVLVYHHEIDSYFTYLYNLLR